MEAFIMMRFAIAGDQQPARRGELKAGVEHQVAQA